MRKISGASEQDQRFRFSAQATLLVQAADTKGCSSRLDPRVGYVSGRPRQPHEPSQRRTARGSAPNVTVQTEDEPPTVQRFVLCGFAGFRDNKPKRNEKEVRQPHEPPQRKTASGAAPSVAFQTEDEPPTVQERVQALAARFQCDGIRGAQAPTAQAVHLGEQPPPPHLNG